MYLELLKKYKEDRLTPDELHELKQMVGSLDEEELALLLDRCDVDGHDECELPDEVVLRIREHCMEEAGIDRRRYTPRWLRPVMWVAAVMIPVLLASTIYLFMQSDGYRRMAESDIAVVTGQGERVTAVLPDGSKVDLSYMSELRYTMASFNSKHRVVRFSGEGFFTVSRDEAAPFVVDAEGIEVTVLGTMFNLHVRQDEEMAILYLDEGSVELRTSSNMARLSPGQLASVNRITGHIEVSGAGTPEEYTAWRDGYLSFDNRPIGYVLAALSSNYGYNISIDVPSDGMSGFTGRIPADNFSEALSIIEYAYHLNARIDGRTVVFTK